MYRPSNLAIGCSVLYLKTPIPLIKRQSHNVAVSDSPNKIMHIESKKVRRSCMPMVTINKSVDMPTQYKEGTPSQVEHTLSLQALFIVIETIWSSVTTKDVPVD